MSKLFVTQGEFAKHVDLTARRVREMKAEGILPAELFDPNGKVDLQAGRIAYIKHLREVAAGRRVRTDDGEVLDVQAETAALKRQQRLNAEQDERRKRVEADLAEGRVIGRDQVAIAASFIVASARNKIVALPTRISSEVQGLTRAEITTISEISNQILEELTHDLPDAIAGAMTQK